MPQRKPCILLLLAVAAMLVSSGAAERTAPAPGLPNYVDGWGWAVDPDGTSTFGAEDGSLVIVAPGPVQDMSIELGRMNAPRTARRIEAPVAIPPVRGPPAHQRRWAQNRRPAPGPSARRRRHRTAQALRRLPRRRRLAASLTLRPSGQTSMHQPLECVDCHHPIVLMTTAPLPVGKLPGPGGAFRS
ncbi:MAG: hypothetical protein ACYC6Y_26945 [Thermoguttaceae bacterium]